MTKPRNPSGKGGFKKGRSGNPGGRPKTDVDVRALARGYTAQAIETLAEIMDGSANERARVAAANALLDRAWGKAAQPLDGDGEGGPITVVVRRFAP